MCVHCNTNRDAVGTLDVEDEVLNKGYFIQRVDDLEACTM